MKRNLISLISTGFILLNMSACTYIKSLFPDKEKDYQYTTEIPPLILPDDLKNDQVINLISSKNNKSTDNLTIESDQNSSLIDKKLPKGRIEKSTSPQNSLVTKDNIDKITDNSPTITENNEVKKLILSEQDNQFELNAPVPNAWRMINKTLSRKAIEIIDRNPEAKIFTVHFDPDEQKTTEDSYWDKAINFFDDLKSNNDIYLIKLQETNQNTTLISLVDKNEKKLTSSSSSQLLIIISTALKEDLSKQ